MAVNVTTKNTGDALGVNELMSYLQEAPVPELQRGWHSASIVTPRLCARNPSEEPREDPQPPHTVTHMSAAVTWKADKGMTQGTDPPADSALRQQQL